MLLTWNLLTTSWAKQTRLCRDVDEYECDLSIEGYSRVAQSGWVVGFASDSLILGFNSCSYMLHWGFNVLWSSVWFSVSKSAKCIEVLYRGHLKLVCENVVVCCPLTILVSSECSPAHNDMHVNPDALLVYPQNTAMHAKNMQKMFSSSPTA